jgi:uncharacterized protein YndB with AHSA1/START domain
MDETHAQLIGAPADDVWAFMVDPGALSVWFGADAWLDPIPGGAVSFRFLDGSVRRGTIVELDPGQRLAWTWREHRGAGFGSSIGEDSTVTIDLVAVDGGTRVTIHEQAAPTTERAASEGAAP